MNTTHEDRTPWYKIVGLVTGPALATSMVFITPPADLSLLGWGTAAIALWMAIWWLTEAFPLAVTALLPIVIFPIIGLGNIEATAAHYAHPLIFLFLGGFLIARALTVWRLDRRLARFTMRNFGTSRRNLVAAMMAVTAFLSMWVSNTATAMVMLPIGLSINAAIQLDDKLPSDDFSIALLLGIAYAATIGGMGTIIGTPPNALFVAYMETHYSIEVGFLQWMQFGVPLVLIMLPICWFILTRVCFTVGAGMDSSSLSALHDELAASGPLSRPEKMVALVVLATAGCWLFRPLLNNTFSFLHLTDAGIAMIGAISLFVLPVDLRKGQFLLDWKQASGIRWDILILFGGGLSLAAAISNSDLAIWIGSHFTNLNLLPLLLSLAIIGLIVVLVGELASNTAMAAVFLPIVAASAENAGQEPMLFTLAVALFATLGFMLPVATPPNAIVFGSGALLPQHMIKAGLVLDLIGIAIICIGIVTIRSLVST